MGEAGVNVLIGNWYPLDSDELACNWIQERSNSWQRHHASASSLNALAWVLNNICCRQPRMIFCQAQPFGYVDSAHPWGTLATYATEELYAWRYQDIVKNATSRSARALALPPLATTSDCFVGWNSLSSGRYNARFVGDRYEPVDAFCVELTDDGRAPSNVTANDQINTYGGFTVADVVVQDNAISAVDLTKHVFVRGTQARPGTPILAGTGIDGMEGMRAAFHEARSTNVKIVGQWHAQRGPLGWITPESSNEHGIIVAATSFVNAIDQTFNARDGNSPGFSDWGFVIGVGYPGDGGGLVSKVRCSVYAHMPGGGSNTGTVKFIGPIHVENNYQEIVINEGGAGPAWYDSAGFVSLNTWSRGSDDSEYRNKIDVHAKVDSAGTPLYIYAIRAWIEY